MMHRPAALLLAVGSFAASGRAAVPVPLTGPAPVALDKLRVNNPAVLPLAGTWKFSLAHGALTENGFRRAAPGAASASSFQVGSGPDAALDNKSGKWCASSEAMPQWWMVDLGSVREVAGLDVEWEFDDTTYRFKVEGSRDKAQWDLLADKSGDAGGKSGPVEIGRPSARWLRITVLGAKRPNSFAWACIKHVGITVMEDGKAVPWKPETPIEDSAIRDAFAAVEADDKTWSEIAVPANWEMAGFSKPTYDQPDEAVGLYRRWVDVPTRFAGQRVLWHFDGVFAGAEIFVNGKSVGVHDSGFTAFDLDVTDALKSGQRNLLAVRVSKTTPTVDLDTGDFWSLGGIYRENYLLALPPIHVTDIAVKTDLDDQNRNAQLKATVQVTGAAGSAVSLSGQLIDSSGKRVPGVELHGSGTIAGDGTASVAMTADVAQPRLWSAEKPNLYFLVLTLNSAGRTVETVQERFGFRQIVIKNGVLYWNGTPIKCTGVDRHEEWADRGHALDETAWRTDLKLMKSFNINAIRTSHYNPASRFLELCDEMGFYVLDEVPFCWADPNRPAFKEPFVQRARETLARDKDHPSILAWSLGNESGYGPASEAAFNYVKAEDPSRPALVSMCGYWNNPKLDFADFHYPGITDMQRISGETRAPAIFTEQPHIFYGWHALQYDPGAKDLWGRALARNWDFLWSHDHMTGSFVWEWQDQGLADKFPGKSDINELTGLRGDNNKGLVDSYRKPKPETWHLKMVYSPVTIAQHEVKAENGNFIVLVTNRYSFTDLSELSCRWEQLAGTKVLAKGEYRLTGAPRTSVEANCPVTPGADTLRLEFFHPDGRSVYATRLKVVGTAGPSAPAPLAPGELSLEDDPGEVRVGSAGTQLIVDKKTGEVRSWTVGDKPIVSGGPILNLGEGRYTWGEHGAKNFLYSKSAPLLKDVAVSAARGENTVRVLVSGNIFIAESPESKGRLTYTLSITNDAQMDVTWKVNWTAGDINLWEAGLKFQLPAGPRTLQWSREGQWTEYPAGHIGVNTGEASSDDISFRATKRDVNWIHLSSAAGEPGLAALATNGPLHARARTDANGMTLFLSSQVPPPYDFSTNLIPEMNLSLKTGQSADGSFRLRLVK